MRRKPKLPSFAPHCKRLAPKPSRKKWWWTIPFHLLPRNRRRRKNLFLNPIRQTRPVSLLELQLLIERLLAHHLQRLAVRELSRPPRRLISLEAVAGGPIMEIRHE